jgi:hypothetical protein
MTRWRHATPPGSFDSYGSLELVRYAGPEMDEDSGQPVGAFQLAARLANGGGLDERMYTLLQATKRWFNQNLDCPRRFSHHRDGWRRSASGSWVRNPIAISWFKPTAEMHLKKMSVIIDILRASGIQIQEHRAHRPGYVTYEDEFQLVAVPFSDEEVNS